MTWEPGVDEMLSNAVLYVDGVPETISSLSDIAINTSVGEDVHIGNYQNSNHYQGLIEDVRIYDRVLDVNEIQQLAGW